MREDCAKQSADCSSKGHGEQGTDGKVKDVTRDRVTTPVCVSAAKAAGMGHTGMARREPSQTARPGNRSHCMDS